MQEFDDYIDFVKVELLEVIDVDDEEMMKFDCVVWEVEKVCKLQEEEYKRMKFIFMCVIGLGD